MILPQVLIAGLVLGSLYALLAASLSFIYSSNGFVSFAIGAQAVLGGYITYVYLPVGIPPWVRVVIGVLVVGVIGVVTWILLYRRVFARDHTAAVVLSLGTSLLITDAIVNTAGDGPKAVVSPFGSVTTDIAGVFIPAHSFGVVATAAACIIALAILLGSSTGKTILALFEDAQMAEVLGLRAKRVVLVMVFISGALSGLGGILIAPLSGLDPHRGITILLAGFVGAVLGGMRSIWASVLGGLAVGMVESLFAQFVSADFRTVVIYGVMVIVVILRPSGLFARKEMSRV